MCNWIGLWLCFGTSDEGICEVICVGYEGICGVMESRESWMTNRVERLLKLLFYDLAMQFSTIKGIWDGIQWNIGQISNLAFECFFFSKKTNKQSTNTGPRDKLHEWVIWFYTHTHTHRPHLDRQTGKDKKYVKRLLNLKMSLLVCLDLVDICFYGAHNRDL